MKPDVNLQMLDKISNIFRKIGKEWMLINVADDGGKVNSMTASWGTAGILWGRPVVICFIRPQRYTFGLAEKCSALSFSFFDEGYREALGICGTKSGRDCDKLAEAGLTAAEEDGIPYIAEAEMSLLCRKLYEAPLTEASFVIPEILDEVYPERDLHTVYICEIEKVITK